MYVHTSIDCQGVDFEKNTNESFFLPWTHSNLALKFHIIHCNILKIYSFPNIFLREVTPVT